MPSHWNYWEREALAYESGITAAYSESGIIGPRLLASYRRPNVGISLWLEDAQSEDRTVPGPQWSMEDYRRFAYSLSSSSSKTQQTRPLTSQP